MTVYDSIRAVLYAGHICLNVSSINRKFIANSHLLHVTILPTSSVYLVICAVNQSGADDRSRDIGAITTTVSQATGKKIVKYLT